MDKDLSTLYGLFSGLIGFLFGIEVGVAFCTLGGAFLSVRFCEPKSTFEQVKHVVVSTVLACVIVGGTSSIYPAWMSLRIVGLLYGFLVLLFAEKIYFTVRDVDLKQTLVDWLSKMNPFSRKDGG